MDDYGTDYFLGRFLSNLQAPRGFAIVRTMNISCLSHPWTFNNHINIWSMNSIIADYFVAMSSIDEVFVRKQLICILAT